MFCKNKSVSMHVCECVHLGQSMSLILIDVGYVCEHKIMVMLSAACMVSYRLSVFPVNLETSSVLLLQG